MSTSEKIVIRRRSAIPEAESTPASKAPDAAEAKAPASTPASPEAKAKASIKVGISRPTSTETEEMKQARLKKAQEAQDEIDNAELKLPSFMEGVELRSATEAEIEEAKNARYENAITIPVPQSSKTLGKRVATDKIDEAVANDVASKRPGVKKIKEGKYFSEAHRDSVIKNNDFVENNTSSSSVNIIKDDGTFEKLINGELSDVEVIEDNEYAQAASRSVIASISSVYSVVLMHSGYQVNFTSLKYLSKSKLLNRAENLYHERRRLYETMYNQIESMTGGKPSFDRWLKITSFLDTASILFGVYAATYPTPQIFTVSCPRCGTSLQISADPESIVQSYDDEAHQQVIDVINSNPDTQSIIDHSALSIRKSVPLDRRKSVIYVKEPSIHEFLEMISVISKDPKVFEEYGESFEKTMFIEKILIPDTAHYKREGKLRFVKLTDKVLIMKFISNLEDDEGEILEDAINSINEKYNVRFVIPEFKCNGLLKNENGTYTDQPCNQVIESIDLDIERLLFRRLQKKALDMTENEDQDEEV